MNHIPVEIARLIFSFLLTRDKLECMTVCQRWHDIIHHHILSSHIYIEHQQQLGKLIKAIKKDPILGANVEQLYMRLEVNSQFDQKIFPALFPNLRDFSLKMINPFDTRPPQSIKEQQTHPWNERMEKLIDGMSDINARMVLYAGICRNLSHLGMAAVNREPGRGIIEKLVNAPALKSLDLRDYMLSFQDLELLHEAVPLLNSLALYSIKLVKTSKPLHIKPATSMNALNCHSYSSAEHADLNVYLRYLCDKYTHLKELMLELNILDTTDFDDDMVEQGEPLITSVVKNMGSRLKTLKLHVEDICDYFTDYFDLKTLDESGCEIKRLDLGYRLDYPSLEQLTRTTQVHHIQSLSVNSLQPCRKELIKLDWLKYFTALKHLTVGVHQFMLFGFHNDNVVSLTDLIENLNGNPLVTLELQGIHLKSGDTNAAFTCPSLKKLALYNVILDAKTDLCIAQLFPNLKHLTLNQYSGKEKSFMFANLDLSYVEIINRQENVPFPILVVTLRDGQQRMYNTSKTRQNHPYKREDKESRQFISPSIHSKPFNPSNGKPMMTFTCNSLYAFSMVNLSLSFL